MDYALSNATLLAYEFLCSAAPALIVLAILAAKHKRHHIGVDKAIVPIAVVYVASLCCMLHLTGTGTLHDAMRFGIDFNAYQLSLVPFDGLLDDIVGCVLNILLFVPLGFLATLLIGNETKARDVGLSAFFVTFAIELSQLLNSRVFDTDDLIMNVLGALIGYSLCRMLPEHLRYRSKESAIPHLVAALTVVAFVGRFFFYNEMGAAMTLFGI